MRWRRRWRRRCPLWQTVDGLITGCLFEADGTLSGPWETEPIVL